MGEAVCELFHQVVNITYTLYVSQVAFIDAFCVDSDDVARLLHELG